MEKHLFQMISRGSSNTMVYYGGIRGKMRKNAVLTLSAMVIAFLMIGVAWAQTSLAVNPSVVKPGETVAITGSGPVGSTIIIDVMNTRTTLESFNVTVGSTGRYSVTYQIPSDAATDVYTVKMQAGDELSETKFSVSKMTPQQLVNTIRNLALNAKKQAETALIVARNQGLSIPVEVREKYSQGLVELENAVNSIQSQNYVSAQVSLQEAMNLFREVVEYSYGENVVPPVYTTQLRVRVQERIDQLWRQYSEINAVVEKLGANGINVEALEAELNKLRTMIGEAQSLLDAGQIAEAEQNITRIQLQVTQRLAALRQRQPEVTKQLAERYQTALENRVEAYIDTFQKLQSVRPAQSALALQELETLRQRLTESSTLIDTGNTVVALREMQSTEQGLKRLANTVNGAITSRLLNRIDELTANLQRAPSTDQSLIENEINQTKDTLSDYLRRHPSNRPVGSTQTPSG